MLHNVFWLCFHLASSEKTSIAKVTFDYEAENDDELSLKEGEIVEVLSQEEEGWWKGSLNGKVGVFPANFVELEKGVVSIPKAQPAPPPIAPANEEHGELVLLKINT